MTLLSFQKRPIPLPEGMDQTGYIARFGGARGVLDQPEIKVLFLRETLDPPCVFVFCDLLGLSPAHTRLLEQQIARLAGTSPDKVAVTATHTHSAPASMSLLLLGECRESWTQEFEDTLFSAVRAAKEASPRTVRISFGKTQISGIARNRVKRNETDVDEDATLIVFEGEDFRLALVNYACHPVTKNADNRLYSRDYPGVIVDTLRETGVFDEVIFATAPCGDLNPILQDEPGRHERMQEYGQKIASAIAALAESSELTPAHGVSLRKIPLTLPLEREHSRSDLDLVLRRACENRQNAQNAVSEKYEEANFLWALSHKRLQELSLEEEAFDATLTLATFGELTVLGVPFELFSGIGIKLKQHFAPACVWELCGGNFGYFASDELWEMADYERADAYMYYNRRAPLPRGSEARLIQALTEN